MKNRFEERFPIKQTRAARVLQDLNSLETLFQVSSATNLEEPARRSQLEVAQFSRNLNTVKTTFYKSIGDTSLDQAGDIEWKKLTPSE